MPKGRLILVHASKSRPGGEWADDDFDVRDGNAKEVGHIFRPKVAPPGRPWFWTFTERSLQRPTDIGYARICDEALTALTHEWAKEKWATLKSDIVCSRLAHSCSGERAFSSFRSCFYTGSSATPSFEAKCRRRTCADGGVLPKVHQLGHQQHNDEQHPLRQQEGDESPHE